MNLPERWMSLRWNGRSASAVGSKLGPIISSYDRPERAYHNLTHLQECLEEFDRVRPLIMNPSAVELALWYHDIVYDTHPRFTGWNEAASAGVAYDHLSDLGLAGDFICKVQHLILVTRHDRLYPDSDRDSQFIADIDLSIFGKSQARVDQYERGIRKEYDWVKDPEVFKQRRREILKMFLARGKIYQTAYFQKLYEEAARANLGRLIAGLS